MRREFANWVRALAATLVTAAATTIALMTNSWLAAVAGGIVIVTLFVAAHLIERPSNGAP